MLSKIVSTIQDSANTASLNTFWVEKNVLYVFRYPSCTLVKLFLKLWTALLIGAAENCPISFPVRLLIQKLFWASDEGFKIASCVTPRHDISMAFQFEELLGGHCSFSQSFADNSHIGIVDRHVQCIMLIFCSVWHQSVRVSYNDLEWPWKAIRQGSNFPGGSP